MYSLIVFTARQMIAVHGSIFLSGSAEHGTWLIACKNKQPAIRRSAYGAFLWRVVFILLFAPNNMTLPLNSNIFIPHDISYSTLGKSLMAFARSSSDGI